MLAVLACLLFFLFSSLPAFAAVHICKFSSQTTSDWVQVCNGSDQVQDLSTYSIQDSIGNSANLNCFLPSQKSYSLEFSKYLNQDGDYILLKNGDQIVDCVSYGNQNCPADDTHTPDPITGQCLALAFSWGNTDDCSSSGTANCQTITLTPAPSAPTLTPTSATPSSTLTPAPSLTPTPSATLTPTPVPASPLFLRIDSAPSSVSLGSGFVITLAVENGQPNTAYYLKAYEDSSSDKAIDINLGGSWQACYSNTAWTSLPAITTNSDGNLSNYSLTLRPQPNKSTGTYQIKVKIRHPDNGSQTAQSFFTINVVGSSQPAPTSTPAKTPTPIKTPTSTKTPTPTLTPTPTPTSSTPTPDLSHTPTPAPGSEVLGIQDVVISPTPQPAKFNLAAHLPKIFITLGSLLLATPLLIDKLKK